MRDVLEGRPVAGVEQPLMQHPVGGDVTRADMRQVAHARASRHRHLLTLLDRQVGIVNANERQVPLPCRTGRGSRGVERRAHQVGQPLDLRLGVRVAAQREEVVVGRRRHDHTRPHPRLEDAVDDLLVDAGGAELLGVRQRGIARRQPRGLGGPSAVGVQHFTRLHACLVAPPLHRQDRVFAQLLHQLRRRDGARTRRVAREHPVRVELGQHEPREAEHERGEPLPGRVDAVEQDLGVVGHDQSSSSSSLALRW